VLKVCRTPGQFIIDLSFRILHPEAIDNYLKKGWSIKYPVRFRAIPKKMSTGEMELHNWPVPRRKKCHWCHWFNHVLPEVHIFRTSSTERSCPLWDRTLNTQDRHIVGLSTNSGSTSWPRYELEGCTVKILFGLRYACKIFNTVADDLEWCIALIEGVVVILHYFNDFAVLVDTMHCNS